MSNYGMQVDELANTLNAFTASKKGVSFAGEEVVTALGSEVDRLEKEIQELVPGIRHVDIEAHNPIDLSS